ncbi:Rossmann-fold NAD(P)-binding domain-containing protein [Brevibacterium atlanticum]|uniref:NAD(P)-dependent oxidoreductase n=1 Tax=Brevibacterium atlanticum TaxID=2697563 RepID=UPI001420AF6B|nr:NAD(P)-dependent oxidoreductase [Brevibacterium atlanticum]
MHILIFGASGHVGTGLARQLGSEHRITGVVRSAPTGETSYAPVVLPAWVEHPESVTETLTEAGLPPIDAVIAAIGGWYVDRPVLERGLSAFDEDYDSYLRGHFSACAASEALASAGMGGSGGMGGDEAGVRIVHLALNGVASVEALPGSGAISVFGAAQKMLIEVAAAESTTVGFRELRIMAPIGGDDRNDLSGGVETVGLAEVAAAATAILHSPDHFEVSTEIGAGD